MTSQTAPDHHYRELTVGLGGFNDDELALIAGVCRLSQARANTSVDTGQRIGFRLVALGAIDTADIYLLDADHPVAAYQEWLARARADGVPLVLVSNHSLIRQHDSDYPLSRDRLGGLLLRQLDKIVTARFRRDTDADAGSPQEQSCLLIDGNMASRAHTKLLLDGLPLIARSAGTAETGLLKARVQPYRLVMVSTELPDGDGFAVCKQLKSDPAFRRPIVVSLHDRRSPLDRIHATLVGCDRVLDSPVDADKLSALLQRYGLIDKDINTGAGANMPRARPA